MNLWAGLKKYADSWSVKESYSFDAETIGQIKSAKVGYSKKYPDKLCCCFTMVQGHKFFVPLTNDSNLKDGDTPDLATAKMVIFEKDGEDDIKRFDAEPKKAE